MLRTEGGCIMIYLHKETETATTEKDDDGEGAKILVPC